MVDDQSRACPFSDKLLGEIETFDSIELLQRTAAIQLLPENAPRLLRLEFLAGALASRPESNDQPTMSASRYRCLIDGGVGVSYLEDPVTWPFVESLTFTGGEYLVLPGLTEGVRLSLDLLLGAALLSSELRPAVSFRNAIAQPCQALLSLSDAICRTAALYRYQAPMESDQHRIPATEEMDRLKSAVTWTAESLAQPFIRATLSIEALAPFSMALGVPVPPNTQPGYGPLIRHPIILNRDQLIVALPHALLTALSQFVLDTAYEHGVLESLSQSFHNRAVSMVSRALRLMGLPMLEADHQPESTVQLVTEQFRILDTDKLLHALISSDDLSSYNPAEPFGNGSYPAGTVYGERLAAGVEQAERMEAPASEVLGLLVIAGVSRNALITLEGGSREQQVLLMHLRELAALSYLEPTHPLYLWHFSRARARLRSKTKVISMSLADELFFYRANDSSFYLTDGSFTHLSLQPNEGGALLLEASRKYDPHAIHNHRSGYQDCVRVYPDSTIPAYCPRVPVPDEPAQCIEVGTGTVWVRTNLREIPTSSPGYDISLRLVDAIAFWVSRMRDVAFVQAAGSHQLTIQLVIERPQDWMYPAKEISADPVEPHIDVRFDGKHTLIVMFYPDSMELLVGSTGFEERTFFLPVFRGIAAATGHPQEDADLAVEEALVTPQHRRFVPVERSHALAALNRPLPPKHLVEAAAEQEVLDEIGCILQTEDISTGPILGDQRTCVLNRVVACLFKTLVAEISQQSSDHLLEWLIAHNEVVIDEQSISRHLEPFNVACFADDAGPAKEFANKLIEMYTADQSCRFLIEYVAAAPPNGDRMMSYGTYDRLLALASKIIFFGMTSDDIHYGSDDPSLAVLDSGRLGISKSRRHETRDQFVAAFGSGQRAELLRKYEAVESQEMERAKGEAADAVHAASKDEFGFTIEEHDQIMDVAIAESVAQGSAVTNIKVGVFLDRIKVACSADDETATAWLDALALTPRDDFFCVPKPAAITDVYPWRYNRLWSYVRRPFIIYDGTMYYGSSHVNRAGIHLRSLCFSGRLKARTQNMRRAIGRVTGINGHRFNRSIAAIFRTRADLVVRERVDRFGKLHIASEKGTLGDIDVLVADPRRRCLRAYECKDLSVARVPSELHNEMRNLVEGEKSIVARHSRRVEWLKKHLDTVLAELRVSPKGRWDVGGTIIVDEELLSPFLVDLTMPLLSIAEVEEMIKSGGRLR